MTMPGLRDKQTHRPRPTASPEQGATNGRGFREKAGRRLLPRSRRLVTDLLYFSKKIPSQPVARQCRIPELARLQRDRNGGRRIRWAALFMKAYALLSARHSLLRQCYMPLPWPHVYQHDIPIGRITVSRQHAGEEWVFFGRVPSPDQESLEGLQDRLEEFKHAPIETIDRFRLQDLFSHVPMPLRRLAWWLTLHVSGSARVDRLGTFGMTTVSGRGALSIHPPLIATTTMTFGPVDEDGNVQLTIVYDHRLMDGGTVAAFLEELESLLNGEILEELRALNRGDEPQIRDAPDWTAPNVGREPSRKVREQFAG